MRDRSLYSTWAELNTYLGRRKWYKFDGWFRRRTISRAQFIFTMFNGLTFGRWEVRRLKRSWSTVKIPMWAIWSYFMGQPKLDTSNFIDSNVYLFKYLIQGIRFGTWKGPRLNWALRTWPFETSIWNYFHTTGFTAKGPYSDFLGTWNRNDIINKYCEFLNPTFSVSPHTYFIGFTF